LGKRLAGKALLAALKPGDTIILAKQDRGFRSVADFSQFVKLCQKHRWNLVWLNPRIDLSTPNGRAMANFYALVAEWSSDMQGQRVKDALAAKKATGKPANGAVKERLNSLPSDYRPSIRNPVVTPSIAGRVWIYLRCSHRTSVESGLGLQAQQHACQQYVDVLLADRPELEFAGVVTDPAVSALKTPFPTRTHGGRLHRQLSPGDHIIVLRPDRVFCSIHDMSTTLFDWKARGITAHFAEDRIDLGTEYGELILTVLVSFAQMERQLTSSRCRDARAVLVADGKFAGGNGPPPFWKLHKSGGVKKLILDRKQLATFRLARLYLARGATKQQALEQVEALLAKREQRLPIPLTGTKRLGRFRTLPKQIRPNCDGWILPLWTVSRFDKAALVFDDSLCLWRSRMGVTVTR
jgi:DNA invertase Pin-like site-specific DNA recombinase